MAYTGGPLNELNGKMGISAPYNSVPVMKLINAHKPKSKEELVELIDSHQKNNCACGVKSQGTVESFGKRLFDSQKEYWGENRYTLKECLQWEYDLFVTNSLRGGFLEKEALKLLKESVPELVFEEADGYLDEEFRVDILVKSGDTEICGIQVKPNTFKLMRPGVISFNQIANLKWGKPVFYLYYNASDTLLDIPLLIEEMLKLKR